MPFEGAGAVSEWRLELPPSNNQFDLSTISDVIMHIRYTAVPSSNQRLIDEAKAQPDRILPQAGVRHLVLNQEFSTAWHRFMHPAGEGEQVLKFTLKKDHLPFYARNKHAIHLTHAFLLVDGVASGSYEVKMTVPGGAAHEEMMAPDPAYGDLPTMKKSDFATETPVLGDWQLQIRQAAHSDYRSLSPDDIQHAYLIVGFSLE